MLAHIEVILLDHILLRSDGRELVTLLCSLYVTDLVFVS